MKRKYIKLIMLLILFLGVILFTILLSTTRRNKDEDEKEILILEFNISPQQTLIPSYECSGYCYCEEVEDEEERRISSVIKSRKSLTYFLSAFTSLVAYKQAKDYFFNKCNVLLKEEICVSIKAEVDVCEIVYEEDGDRLDRPDVMDEGLDEDGKLEKLEKFEEQFGMIKKMRKKRDAPVDSKGVHQCFDPSEDEKTQQFQTLIALLLSSQTRDEMNFKAMENLRKLEGGLNVENMATMDVEKIQECVKCVGFWRTKAENIGKISNILLDERNGWIPDNEKDLMKLPGIGIKMATLVMEISFDETTGICVDTHVHRISNRLDWVDTKTPENTKKELEKYVPREYWRDVNYEMVGFGQQVCNARKPKCWECLLTESCPHYFECVDC